MQQQKKQSASPKPEFNWRRVLNFARITLFVIFILGAVATGILLVRTGATIYSNLSTSIATVAAVLALSSFFIPAPPAPPQPPAPPPPGSAAPPTPSNVQSGNVAQNPGADLVAVKLSKLSGAAPPTPSNIQGGGVIQSTRAATGQPVFFFNLPLRDPSEFYGDKTAYKRLIGRIISGGSSSVVGKRRAGKTWLLEYLQLIAPSELGNSYRIGYVSATHPNSNTLAKFVQWALKELKVSLFSHNLTLPPLDQLSQGVGVLREQGIIPVLCIDEFEGLNNNRQEFDIRFFEGLRALAQDDKKGLILVTASMRPLTILIGDLIGHASPFFNIVEPVSLPSFTEKEARDFVKAKSVKVSFTDKESDFFLSQSMRQESGKPCWPPLLLQCVGQLLFDDKQGIQGQPLDGQLNDFDYRSRFEKRLNEKYQPVVSRDNL